MDHEHAFEDFPTYSIEEILVKKLRSLFQPTRARDYYDVYRLLEQESFDNAEIVTALREKIRAHDVNCRGVTFKPRGFTVSRTLFNSSPCAIRVASPQLFGYRFPVSIVCRGEVFSNQ